MATYNSFVMERPRKGAEPLKMYAEQWNGAATGADAPVLLFVHGFGEHLARYRGIFERLKGPFAQGYAFDLRGHGRSQGTRGHIEHFDDHVDDLEAMVSHIIEKTSRPVVLLGHSMGGLITLRYLLRTGLQTRVRAAAVSSPYLKLAFEAPLLKLVAAYALKRALPSLHLRAELNPSHLSHDPHVVEAYVNDRLVHDRLTSRMFFELQGAAADTRHQIRPIGCPLLFLVPGEDRLIDAAATRKFYQNLKHRAKDWAEFPGMYHEVLNETRHDEVDRVFLTWVARASEVKKRKQGESYHEHADET